MYDYFYMNNSHVLYMSYITLRLSKMEKIKPSFVIVLVLGIISFVVAGTGMVSAMPFDGFSDIDITDHTGESYFGGSVANAGDLNNDGYTDLVIGAYDANKAFVYFGRPGFDGTSDLTIEDHTGESYFGRSVANAGDLNNDGYIDLVIGASYAEKAFVYFGGPGFDGTSDLTIEDHTGEGYPGVSVANAGDLNNDGYTDLVVGATGANKAFVYYGGPLFDGTSDLTIEDHTGESSFGVSVANAGDLNNDGYTDLVIGANGANKAFVYYGGPLFDGTSDLTIEDHTGESSFGRSVANAGDLNNDGYTDLVIGASGANKAFVYYGGPLFDGTSDLTIEDHTGESSFGRSVANAGDLNNDDYTDLVVGAFGANKAFVYYGGPGFDGTSDVGITDHTGESRFGYSVANAGDLNNDGYTDLVIGAPDANKTFVYYSPLSSVGQVFDYCCVKMPQPTIVTLQGKLTDSTTGSPVQTGSMRVTIKDQTGMQVWQNTFNNSLFDGVFNIPLGAVQELMLIPDLIYSMEVEIDVDSATFVAADVTFGDNVPVGDVIRFKT
jgi:hypothetical protein